MDPYVQAAAFIAIVALVLLGLFIVGKGLTDDEDD